MYRRLTVYLNSKWIISLLFEMILFYRSNSEGPMSVENPYYNRYKYKENRTFVIVSAITLELKRLFGILQ